MKIIYCILPVHSGASHSFLLECLDSIEGLALPRNAIFHLCIAIDGSLPRSLKECIAHFKENTNKSVKTYINTGPTGLPANLNNVIRQIKFEKGDLVMRMDADDIVANNRLLIQAQFLAENPAIDVVASSVTRINEYGYKTSGLQPAVGPVYPSKTWTNPIIHPTVLIRSEFFNHYGLYNEKFKYAQDWELWARACKGGAQFFVLPERLIMFRFNSSSIKRRKGAQFQVIKLAWYHLRYKKLIFFVVLRSIIISLLPNFLISLLFKIKSLDKKWNGD